MTHDATLQDYKRQKYALSVQDIVRSRSKKNLDFGIEGYWIRKYNPYMDKPLGRKWVKTKIPTFFDMVKKRAEKTPSPTQYQKDLVLTGKVKHFFWSKLPRNTEIDMIMKIKKTGPSPFSYNPEEIKSRSKIFQSKLDRNGFIEDARARANESPPPYDAKYTYVEPRSKGRGFLPTKKDNLEPIKKKQGPDCGSYSPETSFLKTIKRVRTTSISKYNIPLIQDTKVKRKKWVPGAGTYNWEKSFDISTRAPLFKKGKY